MREQVQGTCQTLVSPVDRSPDLATQAQARLQASPYLELRRLACDSHEGVVAIHGRVSSFYLKQLAQAACQEISGIELIQNQVQVVAGGADRRW